jgi:hypothetical protein
MIDLTEFLHGLHGRKTHGLKDRAGRRLSVHISELINIASSSVASLFASAKAPMINDSICWPPNEEESSMARYGDTSGPP